MVVPVPCIALKQPRAILFGKLPVHGDFVARNLCPKAQSAWDAWITQGLEAAGEALGDTFAEAHEAAPPCRFLLRPGSLSALWGAGVISPSVDSVGRRFVIMLAADHLDAAAAGAHGAALAVSLERLIYQAFSAEMDADALIEAAEAVVAEQLAPVEIASPTAAPLAELDGDAGLILKMLRSGLAEVRP